MYMTQPKIKKDRKCDLCGCKMIRSKCPISGTPAWYCKENKYWILDKVVGLGLK
jgi:NADPH-dependent 7-cyano-7-deazaguanine reductase QueF